MTEQNKKSWYIVQTLSGYEQRALGLLKDYIRDNELEEFFGEIIVPTEKIINRTATGKVIKTETKIFPGYVFIQMEMNFTTFDLVRTTNHIIGFVGSTKGEQPLPISDEEAESILRKVEETAEKPRPKVMFDLGEEVRIITGHFKALTGTVDGIDYDKGKLKISLNLLGRKTIVDMDFIDVEKVD